ncbi:60S ribosomal protein L31 [Candidatus Woesearchaeota archaeon]|nr:60S ribosomal protein L31 [Candidatus Woesearchaeota archaeon]
MAADKLEREYVIPLRKGFLKVPRYKRSKKSISVIEEFLKKHMKADVVKLGKYLNEYVWKDGIKNPPSKVEVRAVRELKKLREKHKEEVLVVTAELKSAPVEDKKSDKKGNNKSDDKKEAKSDKKATKEAAKPEDKSQSDEKDSKSNKESTKKTEKTDGKDQSAEKPADKDSKTQSKTEKAAKPAEKKK